MKDPAICPYCRNPATKGCAHLALATAPRDFVWLCIEQSASTFDWRGICKRDENADFLWLETAFCERFLKPLHWFGNLSYEWRERGSSATRDQLAILWSPSPRKLWWELRDHIEKYAHSSAIDSRWNGTVQCPVCGEIPGRSECEHLILHGDDLATADLVALIDPRGAWDRLKANQPNTPESAASFLREFARFFPSIARVEQCRWPEETLGFGENYVFIWAKSAEAFEKEFQKFLLSH